MDRGEGCYLYDLEGNRYVDFANHHTAQILGHNHPTVMEAVKAQMARGIAVGAPMGVEAEIAEEMCRRVASVDAIRFVNSGTESTLHSIRLARGFSGKPKIAKFEGGYHGSHDLVEVSSSAPPPDKAGPADAPHSVATAGGLSPNATSEVLVLPYNDEAAVEKLVGEHRDELACVIFDPKAGTLPLRPEFVRAVREITRKNDVLLIFDEIVGFRTGTGGLQAHYGIDPDLTCFGKIIGGGFPVGAFGGRADIMDLLDSSKGPTGFAQSGTFSAHPVTMAAGLAMLKRLTPEAFDHLNCLNDRLCKGLNDLFSRQGIVGQAVGVGSVFSIYFVDGELKNYRDLARNDGAKAFRVFMALLEEGYFLGHSLGMCCLSLPMEESHIDGLIEATRKAIEKAERG
jgi:glutamate-1-semialdehyde 2,1-aminomutase